MKKSENADDKFLTLTFKGLLCVCADFDEASVQKIMDGLELYLRRHHMKDPGEAGAFIFTGKEWVITSVQLKEEK